MVDEAQSFRADHFRRHAGINEMALAEVPIVVKKRDIFKQTKLKVFAYFVVVVAVKAKALVPALSMDP